FYHRAQAAFTVGDPKPLIGPVGTQVDISGSGFDPETTYEVYLGEVPVVVEAVTETSLQVTIPEGGETGYITVDDGVSRLQSSLPFMVTIEITVTYEANLGFDATGYDLGTLYSTAESTGDSEYNLQIDTFNHSLVMADTDAGTGSPVFGIARVDKPGLELGAASTVEAMALITGILHSPDPVELSKRLDFLKTLSGYSELIGIVQGHFSAGTDFLDSPAFIEGLEALLSEFIESYVPTVLPSADQTVLPDKQSDTGYDFSLGFYNFRRDYPKELENSGWEGLDRVVPVPGVQIPGPRGTPLQKIKMDSAPIKSSAFGETIGPYLKGLKGNPLDWSANLYELDINDPALFTPQLTDGITESYWNYVYDRISNEPLDKQIVPAVLVSSYGDIEAQLVAGIKDRFIPQFLKSVVPQAEPTKLKEDLTIPSELPAVYMIRTFSGAAFPEQAALIASLPGGTQESVRMMVLNILMAANDGLGILIGQSNTISSREWAKFLSTLEQNILTTWTRQTAQGTISNEALLGIVWETRKAVISFLVDKARDRALDAITDVFRGRFGRVAKAIRSGVSVSGKVSSAFSIVERLSALTNAPRFIGPAFDNARMAFAVEDTLVVVGNPWAPIIESFEPVRGYQGSEITIYGDGFSPDKEENIVTFGRASTDPDNPPEATRAEIVSATVTSLQVKVPEDTATGPIIATVVGSGTGSTEPNDPPYRDFMVIPDPEITGVFPETPVGGGPIRIIGTHFPRDSKVKFALRFSGEFFDSIPRVVSDTEMYVSAPASPGEKTISMNLNGRVIGAFPIEILTPPTPPDGLRITVTTTEDGNVRDGDITLREAILLARGELSVTDLTSPPNPRPGGETYETDYVLNDQIGPASRARITYSSPDPIVLTSPLPSVSDFDWLEGIRIDGSAVAGQPLVLDGTEGAFLNTVRIFSSSQDGVLLKGGATRNTGSLVIEDPIRHGLHFEDSAFGNEFTVSVKNPGENGLHFSGTSVFGNTVYSGNQVGIIGPGKWGVVMENGASFNRIGR
ncbi:MAG: IPT/TIG domain-containing protein, partial [Verrucomicrobiae bacterium]|nr:IPT/TIG domain-containing protein [Verrucomicrobiae bacterium]